MNRTQQTFEVPSILSFTEDTVMVERSGRHYEYTRAYVPNAEVKKELKKISGKLDDCLYDDYRREIDTLKPNVHIDKEIEVLMAAEEDIKQSRRNLRRRARKICPSNGPTKEEERELKEMNTSSVRKMYELEDFERDFDTKPFVATEMVDLSFERIEHNIRKRQLALQNLRREIYEASVLRVTGYYMKAKDTPVVKSKRASKTALEKSKRASKTAVDLAKLTSNVNSESDTEEDDSYANVKEVYRTEKLRLENNLEMFNARLQEFLDSRQNVQEVEEVSVKSKRKRRPDVKNAKPDIKTLKQQKPKASHHDRGHKEASDKSDVTDNSHHDYQEQRKPQPVQKQRRRRIRLPRVEIQAYVDSCDHEWAEKRRPKKKKVTDGSMSTELEFPRSQAGSDDEVTEDLVMQPLSEEGSDVNLTQESLSEDGNDVEITKEIVILPLPTLDPMPVYTDNFQASCVLTQLCSSREDFDEDFEPDYVIPPYECERTVYTTNQRKVNSHQIKPPICGRKKAFVPQRR